LAREVPAVRSAPRTLSVRVAEMAVFPSVSTDDAEFDRAFQVGQNQLASLAGKPAAENVREMFAQIAPDADAVRALLAQPVRTAMQKYPRCTFEFHGRYFLVYEQRRLLPDRWLAFGASCTTSPRSSSLASTSATPRFRLFDRRVNFRSWPGSSARRCRSRRCFMPYGRRKAKFVQPAMDWLKGLTKKLVGFFAFFWAS